MALSISHPVSTLDPILVSRVDTGCDTERAIYYSLYKERPNLKFDALDILHDAIKFTRGSYTVDTDKIWRKLQCYQVISNMGDSIIIMKLYVCLVVSTMCFVDIAVQIIL